MDLTSGNDSQFVIEHMFHMFSIEIMSFPINSMVIFHSYVKLPERKLLGFDPSQMSVAQRQMFTGIHVEQGAFLFSTKPQVSCLFSFENCDD